MPKVLDLKNDSTILDAPKGAWRKKLLKFLIVVIILIGVLYLARGWIRNTVIPRAIVSVEGKNLKNQVNSMQEVLQYPFKSLGYKTTDITPAHCSLSTARIYKTEVHCFYAIHAYSEVSQDSAIKEKVNLASANIENSLKQDGWVGEYSDTGQFVSVHKIVTSINQGIDYTPDATYYKQTGDTYCIFSTTSAFSRPKPAAMSTILSCDKIYDFLGVPL